MLLATRCPFCGTVFRIYPADLSTHRDQVRCEHCHASFSMVDNLFDLPEDGNFQNAKPVLSDCLSSFMNGIPVESEIMQAQSGTGAPVRARTDFSNRTWSPWVPLAEGRVAAALRPDTRHLPRTSLLSGIPVIPHCHTFRGASIIPASTPGNVTPVTSVTPVHTPVASHDLPEQPQEQDNALGAQSVAPSTDEPAAAVAAVSAFETNEPHSALTHEEHEEQAPVQHKRRFGFWRTTVSALVTLLAFMLVCVALTWGLRETVMTRWPASQPFYRATCEHLGCHALPVRDIDGIGVAQPILRWTNDTHRLELTMPIHNHLNVALAWPAVNLTLLDAGNHAVTQRVLHPQDYVAPAAINTGIAARSTQTVTVQIDAGNGKVSNFHLEIFYP